MMDKDVQFSLKGQSIPGGKPRLGPLSPEREGGVPHCLTRAQNLNEETGMERENSLEEAHRKQEMLNFSTGGAWEKHEDSGPTFIRSCFRL